MQKVNHEAKELENLWDEADKAFEPFIWGEDLSTFPDCENLEFNDEEKMIL
jgi:hypothetical protein